MWIMKFLFSFFYGMKNKKFSNKPRDRIRIPCGQGISMVLSKYLCLIFSTIFTFNLTLTENKSKWQRCTRCVCVLNTQGISLCVGGNYNYKSYLCVFVRFLWVDLIWQAEGLYFRRQANSLNKWQAKKICISKYVWQNKNVNSNGNGKRKWQMRWSRSMLTTTERAL